MGDILFEIDIPVNNAQPAADVLQPETHIALVEFVEIRLYDSTAVVVDTEVEFIGMHILCEVYKTGAAVLEYIVDQFLYDSEDDQFFLAFEAFFIFMETAAGVDGARAANFLEQVVDGGLQPEVL